MEKLLLKVLIFSFSKIKVMLECLCLTYLFFLGFLLCFFWIQ